ncbi:MAG: ketoacyl-ACP synthase III [Alphaproteobacteria bacterium]|nr:ketoacyl-ACP synthase III [Alphaproteobacteria bacterium]
MLPCRILGTGAHLPGPVLDNEAVVALSPGVCEPVWIEQWTGIVGRHHAGPEDTVASLATRAAKDALANAGVTPGALSRVLLATSTGGDRPGPATATQVGLALGTTCATMDIANGCHGWLSAFDLAARLIATGEGPVLIVGAELLSRRFLNRRDRRTWPLFGDGAAAVVLGPAQGDGGVIASVHETRGEHFRALFAPGLDDPERAEGPWIRFEASGGDMREYVERLLPPVLERALAQAGLQLADIDHVAPHQPNALWLDRLCARLGLDPARVPRIVDQTANIPSAMVPLGLDALRRGPRPPAPGEHVLLFAIGAGVSLGAMVLRVD